MPRRLGTRGTSSRPIRLLLLGHGKGKANASHHWVAYVEKHRKDIAAKIVADVRVDIDHLSDEQMLVSSPSTTSPGPPTNGASQARGEAHRAGRAAVRACAGSAASIPDRTIVLLLALYVCWGSAIPAMKLMVDTVPPLGGAALVFLLAGLALVVAARGRPVPTRVQLRDMSLAGVLLLVGGQGLATVALTQVTASFGAILAATIPLWVVVLSGVIGTRVTVASQLRLAAGFGGIAIVVLTAPNSAIGGAPWAVAAFVVAPILWAAGSLLTAHGDRPADRVVANAIQLLSGGTVLLVLALSVGELDPSRWSDVSAVSVGAAIFLLVFDSLVGFMLYTRLLASAPASLVSTYAYVTPLFGAVLGATVLDEPLWAGAFVGAALVLAAVALELRGHAAPAVEPCPP